jgi:Cyclic nucleotide-binding domain/WS/DGAT C-terminal domain
LDVTPTTREIGPSGDRWVPDPPQSSIELVLSAARDRATGATEGVQRMVRRLRHADGRSVSAAVARLAEYHHDEPPPPEHSTAVAQTWESRRRWNHRRFRVPLLDLRLASRAFGATITDLLLAATAKSWPAFAPDAEEVWVRLPVNVRPAGSVSATNQVAYVIVGLETTLEPVATLRSAQLKFGHAKTSQQAMALAQLTSMARRLPAPWRETHLGRFYNPDLILSSMPALPFALYCQGSPLVDFASCSTLFKGPGKVTVTTIDDVAYGSMLDAGGTDPGAFSGAFTCAIEELCRLGRLRGLLSGQRALAALSTADLDALTASAKEVSFGSGDLIVREGEAADAFYAILGGTAQVSVAGAPRGQLAAGDSFGEVGIFSGPDRAATVSALEPLRTAEISREALLEAFRGDRVTQRPVDEVIESYQRKNGFEDG